MGQVQKAQFVSGMTKADWGRVVQAVGMFGHNTEFVQTKERLDKFLKQEGIRLD